MGAHVRRLNLGRRGRRAGGGSVGPRPGRSRAPRYRRRKYRRWWTNPVLAVRASRARGRDRFREVGELRVKERQSSLELVAANLRAVGVSAEARGNDLHVQGATQPPRGRHRHGPRTTAAMASACWARVRCQRRAVDAASVAISYPGFSATAEDRCASSRLTDRRRPASLTAQAVARALGWAHLDSGALYRG